MTQKTARRKKRNARSSNQTDGLDVRWDTFPLFAFSIAVGILGLVLIGQEKIIDFKRQRITFILTFVVGAFIGGYFFPSPCGQTSFRWLGSPAQQFPYPRQMVVVVFGDKVEMVNETHRRPQSRVGNDSSGK